jgi:DNA-binding Lrp family transcriptional regulator
MSVMDFVVFIRSNPRLPVKVIAERLNCHPRNVQKYLKKIEVVELRGNDPINGRRNVKLYEVRLPAVKRKALA